MRRQNLRRFRIICLPNRRKLDFFEVGKIQQLSKVWTDADSQGLLRTEEVAARGCR
jgi:hypothetical protein